ncbi:hypothetical protein QR680_005078 [Steinernema hermaphroditum]|uniref:Uncharacterized protein n=1 Tax=Steinernema hermaphroditum TaxID=289476 RepID=A0AA39LV10_9BILA|nr:hypothetical protein QR680_005078 [Steinernema hermaphroditum]
MMQQPNCGTNISNCVEACAAPSKDEVKSQFVTREGLYKMMTLAEYSRPNRTQMAQTPGAQNVGSGPVRVSFVRVLSSRTVSPCHEAMEEQATSSGVDSTHSSSENVPVDRICFNIGRELYVYDYNNTNNAADLTKPVDKRVYKGTFPTCHDFNQETASSTSCSLIIGFSAGQIQLIDPFQKEFQPLSRLFNEERVIDKSPVTCLKWVPGQPQSFIASHASGNMYLYNEEYACLPTPPNYSVLKQGDGYTVFATKSKTPRNPVQRWAVGEGPLNQFSFCSETDSRFLATVSHDGFLRVFDFACMELLCFMKSYFGGLLCLAWSPDQKYIVTGGEDDLITVYSVGEKKVVCRGQGHKSWVSHVAFDPYTSSYFGPDGTLVTGASVGVGHGGLINGVTNDLGSEDDLQHSAPNTRFLKGSVSPSFLPRQLSNGEHRMNSCMGGGSAVNLRMAGVASSSSAGEFNGAAGVPGTTAGILLRSTKQDSVSSNSLLCCSGSVAHLYGGVSYRIGSVGHDTQLCLWDLTEDVLLRSVGGNVSARARNSTIINVGGAASGDFLGTPSDSVQTPSTSTSTADAMNAAMTAEHKGKKSKKLHKRGFSFGAKFSTASHESRWGRSAGGGSSWGAGNSAMQEKQRREERIAQMLGSAACPRMNQVPVIEPLICKRVAQERLTEINFRETCLVTACQEGLVCTWARPPNRAGHLPGAGIKNVFNRYSYN